MSETAKYKGALVKSQVFHVILQPLIFHARPRIELVRDLCEAIPRLADWTNLHLYGQRREQRRSLG